MRDRAAAAYGVGPRARCPFDAGRRVRRPPRRGSRAPGARPRESRACPRFSFEQRDDLLVRLLDDPAHLRVDEGLGFGRGLGASRQERARPVARKDRNRTDRRAHPPATDHLARDLRQLLDVRLGARADLVEHDLLGRAPTESDLDLRERLRLAVVVAIGLRCGERHAERQAARDDRHLANGIGAFGEHPDDRVAALVVRGSAAVLHGHHHLALGARG